MKNWTVIGTLLLIVTTLMTACAAPASPPSGQGPTDPSRGGQTGAPTRITVAIRGNPHILYHKMNIGHNFIGTQQMERLVNAGLTVPDTEEILRPLLAEAVPTLENGLWKTFPDGQMETTWKIRPGVQWHDGAPFTALDVVFTAQVEQDRELAMVWNRAYEAVEAVEAPDDSTVVVRWKRSFVEADTLFSSSGQRAVPLPRHVLDQPYTEDRAAFTELPYWSVEFVGTGPFKLREWVPDSHIVLSANDRFVLGRPKIDEIEVRMVPDTNTVVANILAGAIDFTMDGRTIPFEEARQVREQWRDGRMELATGGVLTMFPQFLNSNPPVVADVRFRRALMHGLDRQEMVDSIQGGLARIAHSHLGPGQSEYSEVEPFVVTYDYDPRKSAQIIEGLGYAKGADGTYRDGSGQALTIPLHTTITNINQKATLAVADSWQRLGLSVETPTIPLQRQSDREFMFTLPAFHLIRIGRTVTAFQSLHSAQSPLPENGYAGSNRGRYRSPELDALIDTYFVTIPRAERMEILGQIIRHETDQLALMRVFYDPESTMISNRLLNAPAGTPWNAHEWEIG